jgi:hypothetical protein
VRWSARSSLVWLVAILACFAMPAVAAASSATIRIEGKNGTVVPRTDVTLPLTPVAPLGAPVDETCPGESVVGAVAAATGGDWNGTWDATNGWSIDRIKTGNAALTDNRKWLVFVDGVLINTPPCQTTAGGSSLVLYPACLNGATAGCFSGGFLELAAPALTGPGSPIHMHVYQTTVALDGQGNGTSQRAPSLGASVSGPDNSTLSDSKYSTGEAVLTIGEKGPAVIATSKNNFAPDRADICVTDGADGYCGTTLGPPVAFDPLAFCQTTGSDGYCGSPDRVPPVGRISKPLQAQVARNVTQLSGTVDFDPSLTDHVNLRLVKQLRITVNKVTKRRVWVTRKVRGKKVRKRVVRRKVRKVKQTACYYWSDKALVFNRMKTCNVSTAPLFQASGAEIWSYDFLSALPGGSYTVDVQAVDGAGNTDAAPELGRNRVTFTVK